MKNMTMEVIGNNLQITIDLTKSQGLSSTGKTTIIATSEGNVELPGGPRDMRLGLNLYQFKAR
jgi:hypothetical protein